MMVKNDRGTKMNIEQRLYQAAIDLIKNRYPVGWGGAAAMFTEGGEILTSVAPEVINASLDAGCIGMLEPSA
jgi:cytidine deaminase